MIQALTSVASCSLSFHPKDCRPVRPIRVSNTIALEARCSRFRRCSCGHSHDHCSSHRLFLSHSGLTGPRLNCIAEISIPRFGRELTSESEHAPFGVNFDLDKKAVRLAPFGPRQGSSLIASPRQNGAHMVQCSCFRYSTFRPKENATPIHNSCKVPFNSELSKSMFGLRHARLKYPDLRAETCMFGRRV